MRDSEPKSRCGECQSLGAANALPASEGHAGAGYRAALALSATEKVYKQFKNKIEHMLLLVTFFPFLQFIAGITDRAKVRYVLGYPRGSQVAAGANSPRSARTGWARTASVGNRKGGRSSRETAGGGPHRDGERYTGRQGRQLCGPQPSEPR